MRCVGRGENSRPRRSGRPRARDAARRSPKGPPAPVAISLNATAIGAADPPARRPSCADHWDLTGVLPCQLVQVGARRLSTRPVLALPTLSWPCRRHGALPLRPSVAGAFGILSGSPGVHEFSIERRLTLGIEFRVAHSPELATTTKCPPS